MIYILVNRINVNHDLRFITANPNNISVTGNRVLALATGRTTVVIDYPISSGIWRCDLRYHNAGAGRRMTYYNILFSNLFSNK